MEAAVPGSAGLPQTTVEKGEAAMPGEADRGQLGPAVRSVDEPPVSSGWS